MSDGVIERYLAALVEGDWSTFAACLADDGFTRVGPYGDTYANKDDYVRFLSDLMPTLPGYEMDVARVTYAGDSRAFAELSETVEVDGTPMRTPECLTFELAADGRIRRVEVFTQSRAPLPHPPKGSDSLQP
jgi:ketosteroid isomerase-like protein